MRYKKDWVPKIKLSRGHSNGTENKADCGAWVLSCWVLFWQVRGSSEILAPLESRSLKHASHEVGAGARTLLQPLGRVCASKPGAKGSCSLPWRLHLQYLQYHLRTGSPCQGLVPTGRQWQGLKTDSSWVKRRKTPKSPPQNETSKSKSQIKN